MCSRDSCLTPWLPVFEGKYKYPTQNGKRNLITIIGDAFTLCNGRLIDYLF